MKIFEKIRNSRGALTIEAAIIVSTILFVLFLLIFSFMLFYQKALLDKTASLAAQQGAEIWTDSRKSIENGGWKDTEKNDSLYYRLFNDSIFSGKQYTESMDLSPKLLEEEYKEACAAGRNDIEDKKFAEMRKALYSGLYRGILKPSSTKLRVSYTNTFIERRLEVSISQEIKVPFGSFKAIFTGKNTLTLTGTGTAVVVEPAEYIRNIDLAIEYADRMKDNIDIESKINDIKQAVFGKR